MGFCATYCPFEQPFENAKSKLMVTTTLKTKTTKLYVLAYNQPSKDINVGLIMKDND